MNLKEYFKLRSAKKELKAAATHALNIWKMQRDLVSVDESNALREEIDMARKAARAAASLEEINAAMSRIDAAIGKDSPWRPNHPHGWAENFEVLVVALAVAMAFRCYFFQPFKIPTGSMQPTLWGIHTEAHQNPTFMDKMPLKAVKWAFTGDWYKEIRVSDGGTLVPIPQTLKPGYISFKVAGKIYHVPAEAIVKDGYLNIKAFRDLRPDGTIKSGGVLWSGTVKAGDHVFVNRLTWNFRRPRRGDVMVFSTTGIEGLPQGTHYIKRMSGMPGETVSIVPPNLLINGKVIDEPYTIRRIAAKSATKPNGPSYAGYQTIGNGPAEAPVPLRNPNDSITLGEREYYALGDNTGNSRDSRYWGPVPEEKLLGPAAIVYWPFTRFGTID